MPQFDTFSFLSQLFWVFTTFCFFYIALAYYLLPALAIILKIRRRKLTFSSPSVTGDIVVSKSESIAIINATLEQKITSLARSKAVESSAKTMQSFFVIELLTFKNFTSKMSAGVLSLFTQR